MMSRRERHRRETYDRIFAAAWQTVEREGATGVTIRKVATDVDYSAPVVYQHFANKEALLVAVLSEGFARLHDGMRRAAEAAEPAERVLAIGTAYLDFAERNHHLYRLMTGTSGVTIDSAARNRAAAPVIELTGSVIAAWAGSRGVQLPDPELACDLVWGVVHGMAGIGGLEHVGFARAQQLAQQALRAVLDSWSAHPEDAR
jgi:AcrR family transcriptional regulator